MFENGELIRWYEMYADIMIVRNTGLGIIKSSYKYEYSDWSTVIYEIYRPTLQDTISLEEYCIEKI